MRGFTIRGDVIGYKGVEVWSDAGEGTLLGHLITAAIDLDNFADTALPRTIVTRTPSGDVRALTVRERTRSFGMTEFQSIGLDELIMSLVIPRYARGRRDPMLNQMTFVWPVIVVDAQTYSQLFDHPSFHLLPQPEYNHESD